MTANGCQDCAGVPCGGDCCADATYICENNQCVQPPSTCAKSCGTSCCSQDPNEAGFVYCALESQSLCRNYMEVAVLDDSGSYICCPDQSFKGCNGLCCQRTCEPVGNGDVVCSADADWCNVSGLRPCREDANCYIPNQAWVCGSDGCCQVLNLLG